MIFIRKDLIVIFVGDDRKGRMPKLTTFLRDDQHAFYGILYFYREAYGDVRKLSRRDLSELEANSWDGVKVPYSKGNKLYKPLMMSVI